MSTKRVVFSKMLACRFADTSSCQIGFVWLMLSDPFPFQCCSIDIMWGGVWNIKTLILKNIKFWDNCCGKSSLLSALYWISLLQSHLNGCSEFLLQVLVAGGQKVVSHNDLWQVGKGGRNQLPWQYFQAWRLLSWIAFLSCLWNVCFRHRIKKKGYWDFLFHNY